MKEDALALYFYHLQDGVFVPGREGTECGSLSEARRRAIAMSAELLQREDQKFWDGTEWQITVTDDQRETLFTLNFFAQTGPARAPKSGRGVREEA